MSNKNCTLCVYADGLRADGTVRCTDGARQRDPEVTDCCIPAAPLRELQRKAIGVAHYADVTNNYVLRTKSKSQYWRSASVNLQY